MSATLSMKSYGSRRIFIGGSDARIIMGVDAASLERLWREKRGETPPQDLSANLLVQLGLATEHLNRNWYERTTGRVVNHVQTRVRHPVLRWMAATLDGVVEGSGAVFEAKFMLPWSFSEEGRRLEAERIVDMSSSNAWAEFSNVFRRTRDAYLEHENAKAELKALMPEDAKEAIGHGIQARRSKSGAVTIDLLESEGGHASIQ